MDKSKTLYDFKEILSKVRFANYHFSVLTHGSKFYLQAAFDEKDVVTGELREQKTRKWILSPYMTKSEVVFTAFKCVLASVEHETRETFTYQNQRICSPHFDVDELAELCRNRKFDEREDWYAE